MATSYLFDGKNVTIPGVYTNTKSGIKNPSLQTPYGDILIIDTGVHGATWGGGGSINGTLHKGLDSIYEFDNIFDFRNFIKGGYWWLLAEPLFKPANQADRGVSKIYFVRSATTTPAEIVFTLTGDNDPNDSLPGANGGVFTIQITDEGIIGNGVLTGSKLTKGYGANITAGVVDSTKYIFNFYRGSYTGDDQLGLSYNNISILETQPILLVQSPEISNVIELYVWMNTDANFKKYFKLKSGNTTVGTGAIGSIDKTTYTNINLAVGGTEVYDTTASLDSVIENIKELDISFILTDQYGANANSAANTKIAAAIPTLNYLPELYVAAYTTENNFTDSLNIARTFNKDYITVVHGGVFKQTQATLKSYDVLYKTCLVLAREAGLEPQIPLTFKSINIDGEQHSLNKKDTTLALKNGLLVTKLIDSSFDVVKGINSLQNNIFLVNPDSTISSKQIKRIVRYLNKQIQINAKRELLKNPNGVNRSTLDAEGLRTWMEGFLKKFIITPQKDNLLVWFGNVTVERQGDALYGRYDIEVNSEISFIFTTGVIVNL